MPAWCNNVIYWSFLNSTCFGRIRPSSGDVKLQHMVFCTQYVDGWWSWELLHRLCVRFGWCRTHNLCSGSQDYHPSTNWVRKTVSCNLTSSAPDGNMSIQGNFNKLHCCIKLALHFISWWRCTVKQPSKIRWWLQTTWQHTRRCMECKCSYTNSHRE